MNEPLDERALRRLLAMAAADGDLHQPAEASPTPPTLPARYEIVRELGRGGMGIVYEVIDHQLGRRCALKTLGPAAGGDAAMRQRFLREASAAARLQHPHIATVHDATPEFLTMQLIAGGPIGAAPDLPARAAVELVRDAALALQHAHEQGIVHRDVKPSNLLVEGRHVFVVDFGLARTIDTASSMSIAGSLLGTPAFMAPEQALGQQHRVDARSDVYGLGATLHHCLTGAPPFADRDLPTLLRRVVDDEPPPTGVDRDLDQVIARCLAKEPAERYASAHAFADDLGRWLRDEPVLARRPSWLHRTKKRLRRQRRLWSAAAVAVSLTALVLVPMWLRASAARSAANEAVELADHTSAVLQDAALSAAMGDLDSAQRRLLASEGPLRAFLQRHDVPRVRYLLARVLRAASRPDAALLELDRAIAGDPSLLDARFERGLLRAARSELSAAERQQAIADLGVGAPGLSVRRDLDRLFGRAELLRLQGDPRRAMELLREVLEYDGMYVDARLSLAAAARAAGDDALAVYFAASAVDVQQGFGPFYLARERHTLPTSMLGLPGVLVDFAETIRTSPDNTLGLAHRGLVHLRCALRAADEDRLADALEAVRDAIADHDAMLDHGQRLAVHAGIAGAHNNRAVCRLVAEQLHCRTGDGAAAAADRKAATADLVTAVRLQPDLAAAHYNTGVVARRQCDVLRAMGRLDGAERERQQAATAFAKALELAPADWPQRPACCDQLTAVRGSRASAR